MELTPLELVRRAGALPHARLVEAIAGEPVRGSWWGHPRGKVIYAAAQALADSPEVLVTRLGGRITYLHRALWPALARVVTDADWRARTVAALPADARALLAEVEDVGEVRNPARKPREALECRQLVASHQLHEGRHVTVLRPWRFEGVVEGSLDDALAALEAAGVALR